MTTRLAGGAKAGQTRLAPAPARAMETSNNSNNGPQEPRIGTLLTTKEVALRCKVPEPTVRYWRLTHTGPEGFMVGRHVWYPEEVVETWLNQQRENDQLRRASRRRGDLHAC
ncbi:helix-turn-helix domain-containing protein [Nocardioides litoris]|uniref:helix-turn-helix domain-containing protein n=1 Tax=Nocardioides litoris TaxID=1926648 RepID=UPI001B865906|nr:helix-turn-helix domain-containing protein [Nocardioides litoris]